MTDWIAQIDQGFEGQMIAEKGRGNMFPKPASHPQRRGGGGEKSLSQGDLSRRPAMCRRV
jgi:hypothetical protein